jgi:hypothetical protein
METADEGAAARIAVEIRASLQFFAKTLHLASLPNHQTKLGLR